MDEELTIHYQEWDEKHRDYVVCAVKKEDSVPLILDMYGASGQEGC